MIASPCRKFWCPKCWNQLVGILISICMPKINLSLTSFWDIVNKLKTCYFENLGNAWLLQSKIIVSICRKLSCLSAYKKSTSSLTYFFRYYNEIANLLFWGIWACHAWRNLSCLSADKKSTWFLIFSLVYCRDIAKLLFWVL